MAKMLAALSKFWNELEPLDRAAIYMIISLAALGLFCGIFGFALVAFG